MAQSLNSVAFGRFIGQDDKKFQNELWDMGNDVDRPMAEAVYDLPQVYFDYYFNDERRYDNEEGWNSEDDYFNPDMLDEFEHYDDQDIEEWEIQQEYEANHYSPAMSPAMSPRIGRAYDNWEYFIGRLEGQLWRDLNT